MIEKLEIQKICYDKVTYNNIELDIKWLERNDFNKISVKRESSWSSPIKELIITKNDGTEILLKSDNESFFKEYFSTPLTSLTNTLQ